MLGETLAPRTLAGIALTVAGVIARDPLRQAAGPLPRLGGGAGPLWLGVATGLGAATGQAPGSIIARPVMAAGFDPFAASLVRVVVGGCRADRCWSGCRSPAGSRRRRR